MINGAPTDSNAKPYKDGALNIYKQQGATIVKSYDTPDWSPDKAQQEMEQTVTSLGKTGFDGVYVANDGMATGAVAALKGAGVDPGTQSVTGQDAELTGVQRILVGKQLVTVYQPIKKIAETSAELAVPLAQGKTPPANLTPDKVNNGSKEVPVRAPRHDRDHQGQRQPDRGQGRVPEGQRHLRRVVRERVQGGRRRLTGPTLAVDAGQTETRAALHAEHGPRLARAPGVGRIDAGAGGTNGVADDAPASGRGAGAAARRARRGRGGAVRHGGGAPGRAGADERGAARALHARRIVIASDGVTSLFGALGGRPRRGRLRGHRHGRAGPRRPALGEGGRLGLAAR